LPRSARIPPCTFGCSVTTRCSSISGTPVTSESDVTGIPASASAPAVPPDETSSKPRSCKPRANSARPRLSYTDRSARLQQRADDLRVDAPLDLFDALVERRFRVVREDGHRFLGQDRAFVDLEG